MMFKRTPSFAHAVSGLKDCLDELKAARDLHNSEASRLAKEAAMLDEQRKTQQAAAAQCQKVIGNVSNLLGEDDG